MKIEKKEILFIYNSNDPQDRQALGYIISVKGIAVKEHDVTKDNFTERQLAEIATKLKVSISDLLKVQNNDKPNLSEQDLLKLMTQSPSQIKTPIVLYEDQGDFVDSPFEPVDEGYKTPETLMKYLREKNNMN